MANLWEDVVVDGKHSIQYHEPKAVKQWCADGEHYFVMESPSKRTAVCKKCGLVKRIIIGKHLVKDGKIVSISST